MAKDSATDSVSLLAIVLDDHRFGLVAKVVERVVRAVAIAALPRAPAIVEGVINVAGAIVPVLDIRRRFNLPARPLQPDQHLVIARAGARTVALRVDRAAELLEVPAEAIEPAAIPGVEYVAGLARLEDGLLVIHDLEQFLALDEAAQLDAALAGAAS